MLSLRHLIIITLLVLSSSFFVEESSGQEYDVEETYEDGDYSSGETVTVNDQTSSQENSELESSGSGHAGSGMEGSGESESGSSLEGLSVEASGESESGSGLAGLSVEASGESESGSGLAGLSVEASGESESGSGLAGLSVEVSGESESGSGLSGLSEEASGESESGSGLVGSGMEGSGESGNGLEEGYNLNGVDTWATEIDSSGWGEIGSGVDDSNEANLIEQIMTNVYHAFDRAKDIINSIIPSNVEDESNEDYNESGVAIKVVCDETDDMGSGSSCKQIYDYTDTDEGSTSGDDETQDTNEEEPETTEGEPETSGGEPETSGGEPETSGGEPGSTEGEPETSGGEPGSTEGEPETSGGEPGTTEGEPDEGAAETTEEEGDAQLEVDEKSESFCESSKFGCCPDEIHPAHGPDNLGCCAYSNFTCCPDNLTPAEGPYGEGCECDSSEFGCCPDETTPAKGPHFQGCGCQYEKDGCCPDRTTKAEGPDFQGCGCETHPFGCCPDGATPAQGPNLDGCPSCNSPEFGCCPDGVTPRLDNDDHCDCHSSKFGCCPDGKTESTGPLLQGCSLPLPGFMCNHPYKTGPCTTYEPKWYYDVGYGGCSRFWYGGCEPGSNHFDEEDECKATCVSPRGSAVCFLKKDAGPCEGKYNEWYFDLSTRKCITFVYGGCLGNGNRFVTREECEGVCLSDSKSPGVAKESQSLCDKPKAEGPCDGNYTRWYYNKEAGLCQQFLFSGCMGNNNRFMTLEECDNTCLHKAKEKLTDLVCSLPIDYANCEEEENLNAQWSYDKRKRRCIPIYRGKCGGNENSFETRENCEQICPTVYPPIISLPDGEELLLERGAESALLRVNVKANPPANYIWKINGRDISRFDPHFSVQHDGSLRIVKVTEGDAGTYTVKAENGVGIPAMREIKVIIYPVHSSVKISLEKTIYKPDSEIIITCKIKGYPPPVINWHKIQILRGNRRQEIPIEENRPRVFIDTFQVSSITATSQLVIRDATTDDSGSYKCSATSPFSAEAVDIEAIRVQDGTGSLCIDRPSYQHCDKVIKHRFCGNKYYGQYCCASCTKAGYLPGGLY